MNSNGRLALQRWHRRLGIVAALFVILLAASGLVLNHTDALRLAEMHVRAPFLLERYNLAPASDPKSFPVNSHAVTEFAERLFWDDTEITQISGSLAGAVRTGRLVVVVLDEELLLLTAHGEMIERVGDAAGVPQDMRRAGVDGEGHVVVAGSRGIERIDLDTLRWEPAPNADIDWAQPQPLSESRRDRLLARYRSTALSLEKVILDVHSGRILGAWGPWLMDAAAVLFLVLAVTGIWLWSRSRR